MIAQEEGDCERGGKTSICLIYIHNSLIAESKGINVETSRSAADADVYVRLDVDSDGMRVLGVDVEDHHVP